MNGLRGIIDQYKLIREAISKGDYLSAWENTLPVQQWTIDLARGLNFTVQGDEQLKEELKCIAQECVTMIQAAPAVAGFDWKTFVTKLLLSLLDLWSARP